jgi:hypothetical protein
MSMVEGLITPDLLQLEMGDGTIIPRDDLIDPEYFVVDRDKTVLSSVIGMVGAVAVVEWYRTTVDPNVPWDTAPSWPRVIGLGVGIGIPIGIFMGTDPEFAEGAWKPW